MVPTKKAQELLDYLNDARRLEDLKSQLAAKQSEFKLVNALLDQTEEPCEDCIYQYNKLNRLILVDLLAINEVEKRCLEYELKVSLEEEE